MGVIRKLSRQVAQRGSSLVARHELFERQGERAVQPPLSPDAWSGGDSETAEENEADDDEDEPSCSVSDSRAIRSVLSEGAAIVNHWATWCESCMTEVDAIRALADQSSVPMIGVSWDAFEGGDVEHALSEVMAVAREKNMNWPHYVVSDSPEEFFSALNLENRQVPQTWIVGASGEIVHRVHGVIDLDDVPALLERVEASL